jgi:hypothetical protein
MFIIVSTAQIDPKMHLLVYVGLVYVSSNLVDRTGYPIKETTPKQHNRAIQHTNA